MAERRKLGEPTLFVHTAVTMIAICQLRLDSVLYERFRELDLECSYPHQSQAVMGNNTLTEASY